MIALFNLAGMSVLPTGVLVLLTSWLSHKELRRLRLVSKQFRDACGYHVRTIFAQNVFVQRQAWIVFPRANHLYITFGQCSDLTCRYRMFPCDSCTERVVKLLYSLPSRVDGLTVGIVGCGEATLTSIVEAIVSTPIADRIKRLNILSAITAPAAASLMRSLPRLVDLSITLTHSMDEKANEQRSAHKCFPPEDSCPQLTSLSLSMLDSCIAHMHMERLSELLSQLHKVRLVPHARLLTCQQLLQSAAAAAPSRLQLSQLLSAPKLRSAAAGTLTVTAQQLQQALEEDAAAEQLRSLAVHDLNLPDDLALLRGCFSQLLPALESFSIIKSSWWPTCTLPRLVAALAGHQALRSVEAISMRHGTEQVTWGDWDNMLQQLSSCGRLRSVALCLPHGSMLTDGSFADARLDGRGLQHLAEGACARSLRSVALYPDSKHCKDLAHDLSIHFGVADAMRLLAPGTSKAAAPAGPGRISRSPTMRRSGVGSTSVSIRRSSSGLGSMSTAMRRSSSGLASSSRQPPPPPPPPQPSLQRFRAPVDVTLDVRDLQWGVESWREAKQQLRKLEASGGAAQAQLAAEQSPAAAPEAAAAAAGASKDQQGRLKRFFARFSRPADEPSSSSTSSDAGVTGAGDASGAPGTQQQQQVEEEAAVLAAELARLEAQLLEHVHLMLAGRQLLQRLHKDILNRRAKAAYMEGIVEPAEVLWGVYEGVSFEWIRARARAGKLVRRVAEALGPLAGASLGAGWQRQLKQALLLRREVQLRNSMLPVATCGCNNWHWELYSVGSCEVGVVLDQWQSASVV